jgi:hypothetical protein
VQGHLPAINDSCTCSNWGTVFHLLTSPPVRTCPQPPVHRILLLWCTKKIEKLLDAKELIKDKIFTGQRLEMSALIISYI